ncbi:hypothetical protein PLESTB_001084500 [Pleodorina starrii]|uniref:PDZ domain-containing protein n=1 Tax=Pleodorina starrii TaxID=330485 RepID=A0A9W6F4S9_9CHLO|nr:hypothetical protein PLESTM_001174200 [Pleodorina starrii]GLC56249.1 hypothetical protein PLESTB_001084500 [Pleodorina starrii]GLC69117.1 hypothetical protein PLESTF_000791700 [Pleodorina starrii]
MVFHSACWTHPCGSVWMKGASPRGSSGVSDWPGMALRRPHQLGSGPHDRHQQAAAPCRLCHQTRGTGLRATAGHRAVGRSARSRSSSGGGAAQDMSWRVVESAALGRGRAEFYSPGSGADSAVGGGDGDAWDAGDADELEVDEEEDADGAEEGDEGEEGEEEEDDAGALARSVVQVRTLHRVPNFSRPWEEGHDAESSSSGFVVAAAVVPEPGAPPRRQLLLMTTAGAVEHARKVEVCRAADDATPYTASVAAVCLDLDVALLRVDEPGFWGLPDSDEGGGGGGGRRHSRGRGRRAPAGGPSEGAVAGGGSGLVPLQLDRGLPHLRKPVVMAGFPLGGGSLCVTSGVVSRIEVIEYSHAGRALLALQVDAPLNNGGWGGPALCPSSGRCVGMAFQKFASQTWMERYDDAAAEVYGGEGDEDDGGGGGGDEGDDGDDGGGGGGHGQDYDEDAENIGYLVPAQLLQLVLDDYSRAMSHQQASTSAPGATPAAAGRGARRGSAGARASRAGSGGGSATAGASSSSSETRGSAPVYLDGRPRLGLRYQRLESPVLRRSLGMAAGESGVLVTGVDPTGSAARLVQVHDVLLAVGGRQVSNDGTTVLRPGQRVLFGHWSAVANVGDPLTITVLRGGTRLELSLRLRGAGEPFLPVSLGPGRRPQFLVVGPLVFAAFSLPYWFELMAAQQQAGSNRAARRRLSSGLVPVLAALEWGLPAEDDGEEVVLLTEVLECGSGGADEGEGEGGQEEEEEGEDDDEVSASPDGVPVASEAAAWSQLLQSPGRLATVNGQQVRNLAQLAAAVVRASTSASASAADGSEQQPHHFLRLGLEPSGRGAPGSSSSSSDGGSSSSSGPGVTVAGRLVVLDASSLAADTKAVLRHHSMAAAMSADLRRRLATNWPFEASHQAHGASRQRRQQGRRVALSGRR